MNGEESYLAYCLDQALGPKKLSNRDIAILKKFYMAQRALSQELLEAKPLGTCKMPMSTDMGGETSSNLENSKEMSY